MGPVGYEGMGMPGEYGYAASALATQLVNIKQNSIV